MKRTQKTKTSLSVALLASCLFLITPLSASAQNTGNPTGNKPNQTGNEAGTPKGNEPGGQPVANPTGTTTQGGVSAGVLTCHESSGWGLIFESTRDLRCVYSPLSGSPANYVGQIKKYGVNIGYLRSGVIVWNVIAPTTNLVPGDISGHYAGASGSATVGIGAGVNVLVGGSNQHITLQPVSIEGSTGLNIAAGISDLTLNYQP